MSSKRRKPPTGAKQKKNASQREMPLAIRDAIDDQRYRLMGGCAVLESLAVTLRRNGDDLEPGTAADAMQVVVEIMRDAETALSARALARQATQ